MDTLENIEIHIFLVLLNILDQSLSHQDAGVARQQNRKEINLEITFEYPEMPLGSTGILNIVNSLQRTSKCAE